MWIHVPSTYCHCVQELDNLTSASNWQFQLLEQSAMLRSKPSPAKSWYRVWKKETWMKHLYGQICEPLMANRGVEKWIASLEDTHANPFPLRVKWVVQMILDTFGLRLPELLEKLNPLGVSLKMSETTSTSDLKKSEMNYKEWAMTLRQEYTQRKKLVRRTSETGYSSWRTPANDGDGGTFDLSKQPPGSNPKMKLRDQAANWGTPNSRDWKGVTGLENQKDLPRDVKNWATTTRDWKDGACQDANVPTNGLLGRQVLRTPINGEKSLSSTKQLNPRFSEWLMGWIPGWTHPRLPIEKTDFDQWVTELSRLLLHLLLYHYSGNLND